MSTTATMILQPVADFHHLIRSLINHQLNIVAGIWDMDTFD